MKQFLLLAVLAAAFSHSSFAAACASGSLASYIGLGMSGCTIGTNTLYGFQTLDGTTGATAINPIDLTITPFGGNFNPGITAATSMTASAGTLLEALFTYQIAGNSYANSSISLSDSSETVDGAVTDLQNFCAGGTFGTDGVTDCSALAGSLLTLDGIQNQDSADFSPSSLLSVTDDFTLDGGLAGSASGGTFTDQFTATPEPSTFLLTGLVFAVAATLKFRRIGVSHSEDNEGNI